MRHGRISKRHRPASRSPEPLPLDPRDPDIVRVKQLARRSSHIRGKDIGSRGALG
jgi:hypothetical protein